MGPTKVYANMLATIDGGRLDGEKLRRVVEARTLSDAFKVLGDYGYAYGGESGVDGFIVGETNALISFIAENAASERLKNALLARFVFNNAKLAYKSRFADMPADGYYAVDFDSDKIAKGDYSEAPFMAEALTELDGEEDIRPQTIDLALTRAMYKYVLSCGIPSVKKYFRAEIDMKNILSAARCKRLGLKPDQFIAGGKVDEAVLCESTEGEGFAEHYEHTPYFDYAEYIECTDPSELWRAENEADGHLYYMTAEQVKSYASYKPFLSYYTERLIELKTVKTALVCIKTDSRDAFYKRMPRIYTEG